MAKFCAKCNSPLNEGDRACGYCGTPVAAAPAKAAAKKPPVDVAKLMKDPKVKKFAPVAIIAAVLVVVLLIVAIASGSGAKGAAKKYMKAIIKNNPDKYVDVLSARYFGEDYDEDKMAEYKENFEDDVKDAYDDFEEAYGSNVKIKYEVLATFDIRNEDKLEDIEEELQDEDIDYGKEVKAKKVVLLVTIKVDENQTTFVDEVTLVKEDGKWKVYSKSILEGYYL
jgi:hypothetical protein